MNNEFIPGKLYKTLYDMDIRIDIGDVGNYIKVASGEVLLLLRPLKGIHLNPLFLYKTKISCFQWHSDRIRAQKLLELVI